MDQFEASQYLRNEAIAQGYAYSHFSDIKPEPPIFKFDLNSGEIISPGDPEKVMALVALARKVARSDGYGEHNSLLALVAKRTEVENENVYWHRSYHIGASINPLIWISLKAWLKDKGETPSSVYTEERYLD